MFVFILDLLWYLLYPRTYLYFLCRHRHSFILFIYLWPFSSLDFNSFISGYHSPWDRVSFSVKQHVLRHFATLSLWSSARFDPRFWFLVYLTFLLHSESHRDLWFVFVCNAQKALLWLGYRTIKACITTYNREPTLLIGRTWFFVRVFLSCLFMCLSPFVCWQIYWAMSVCVYMCILCRSHLVY